MMRSALCASLAAVAMLAGAPVGLANEGSDGATEALPCPLGDGVPHYDGSFFAPPGLDPFIDEGHDRWYSKHLRAMGERPLWLDVNSATTVRVTLPPAFDSPGVMLSLREDAAGTCVTRTWLSGAGGSEGGKILSRTGTLEPRAVLQGYLKVLKENRFIELKTDGEYRCTDGFNVVIELRQSGAYRVIHRNSPGYCPTGSNPEVAAMFDAAWKIFSGKTKPTRR